MDVVDPVTKVKVSFRDLTNPKLGEDLIANLIMPEPTAFLSLATQADAATRGF